MNTPPRRIDRGPLVLTLTLKLTLAMGMAGPAFAQTATKAPANTAVAPASSAAATTAPTASTPTAAAKPKPHADVLRLLGYWLDAQATYERLPSLTTAVVAGQDTIFRDARGTLDGTRQGVVATTDTIYSVCSITKLFTSIAAMQLWEQGKLHLDVDIAQYVRDFQIDRAQPDSGPITVRNLLTHSSGLPREGALPYWSEPEFPDRASLMAAMRYQKTIWRPSESLQYSNLAMTMLGEVVAAVSGQPYEDYVREHILKPLQMNDTRYGLPLSLANTQLARGHGALDRAGERPPATPFNIASLNAAAGLTSTVNDLAKLAAWQSRLLGRGGQEILRASTLRDMQRVHWVNDDGKASWGLGFSLRREGNQTISGHDGVCPGYLSVFSTALGDDLTVISMTNAMGLSLVRHNRSALELLQKGLKLKTASEALSKELDAYAGAYEAQPFSSESLLVPWGQDLASVSLPHATPAERLSVLKRRSGDVWEWVRSDDRPGPLVTFERDASGKVIGMRGDGYRSKRLRALP